MLCKRRKIGFFTSNDIIENLYSVHDLLVHTISIYDVQEESLVIRATVNVNIRLQVCFYHVLLYGGALEIKNFGKCIGYLIIRCLISFIN